MPNYVTVTLDLYDGASNLESGGGYEYFIPSTFLTDTVDHQLVTQSPISARLAGDVLPTVSLLATDNANFGPSGWTWATSFSGQPPVPGNMGPFSFYLPAGPAAFTATNANPCVFTWTPTAALTSLPNGTGVKLSGSPPTGFTAGTTYYVVSSSGATFRLAATVGGSAIASSSTGTGNVTVASMFLSSIVQLGTSPQTWRYLPSMAANVTVIASGNLAPNQVTEANAFSGAITLTLPAADDGSLIVTEKLDSSVNAVTVTGNVRGTPAVSLTLSEQYESVMLMAYHGSWWPVATSDSVSGLKKNFPVVLNVLAFGADPTGVLDSTAAINAAIAQATGSAAPATHARTATAPVYVPSGIYKVTADLLIQSVVGFKFYGDGPGSTLLVASGTGFTQAVIFVDGSLDGTFGGFAIQGDGTEQVTDAIRLDWTTNASRSTTANRFSDIRVRALKCVVGVSLEGNGSRQVDGTVMDNIVVTGSQTVGSWSASGNWQAAFALGNGTYSNNYDHVATGCGAALYYYGWKVNASSVDLDGSQPAGNYADFWIATGGQTSLKNIQSQDSGQLIDSPAQFAPEVTSVEDVLFSTNHPNAGYPIAKLNGGIWYLRNISATSIFASSAFQTGVFTIAGTSSVRPCIVSMDNICVYGAKTAVFSNSNANVLVKNYANYNPNTGNYTAVLAGDLLSSWTGGSWSNLDQPLRPSPDIQWFTGNGTWTKPANGKVTEVTLLGDGGGGGSGAFNTTGLAAGGGGGGGGGGLTRRVFDTTDLGSTETVLVFNTGTGGAAATGTGSGNNGVSGTGTFFGSKCWATGGVKGLAGALAAGGAGGAGGIGTGNGGAGGAGSATALGGAGTGIVSGGGGGGAGITAGTAANGGAAAATIMNSSLVSGAGAVRRAEPEGQRLRHRPADRNLYVSRSSLDRLARAR